MWQTVLLWGSFAGLVHFVVIGILYGNPVIDSWYAAASDRNPAMKRWPSKARYLLAQFLGTQVEVFILTIAFLVLRSRVAVVGIAGALLIAALLAAVRVYPRFWNMWIQTTYPNRLLVVEVVNGTIGTFAIVIFLHMFARV